MRAHEIFSKQHSSMAPHGTLLFVRGWDLHSILNRKSYPTHRILQTLLLLITTFFIDGTRLRSSACPLLWKSPKMDRFVDRLKRRIIFSRWNSKIFDKKKRTELICTPNIRAYIITYTGIYLTPYRNLGTNFYMKWKRILPAFLKEIQMNPFQKHH